MTRTDKIEAWVWVLIYGGLLLLSLGLAVGRGDAVLGWSMAIGGGVVAAVGVLLIYIRSRMKS